MASNVAISRTSLCDRVGCGLQYSLTPIGQKLCHCGPQIAIICPSCTLTPRFPSQLAQRNRYNDERSSHGLDTPITTMATCLFSLPLEMREKLYSELLVVAVPIAFEPGDGTLYRPAGSRRRGLYPAILRVNKKAYREASRLLYSKNRCEIPNATDSPKFPETASVALFLSQIGCQASLIRYICIDFPRWDFDQPEGGSSHPGDIRNLELVRASCQNLRVLELSLGTGQDLIFYEPVTAEILDSIDVATKDVLLRKDIVVRIQVYDEDDIQDSVTMMRTHGWTVEVTKREPVKETWEYDEHGIEFDNEDDYLDYVNMIEKEQEKEREEKEWLEDYWAKRNDPWRKNDSDYD